MGKSQAGVLADASQLRRSGSCVSSSGITSIARSPCIQPRAEVLAILDVERVAADVEWMERVEHHGELVGARGAERRLRPTRMRSMRHAIWMERDRTVLDALPAHELRACVIDHLVRHPVREVVG